MIGYHLVRLVKFSGRETRAKFWPWAGIVIGLTFLGSFATLAPMMARSMAKMQQFAREHPDQATITSGQGEYHISIEGHHPELMPDFTAFADAMEGIAAIAIVLLAAAVARRLHDTGRTAAWGLLPLPFLFFGFAQMVGLVSGQEPNMDLFSLLFLNNLCYLGALGLLVLLLSRPGTVTANHYGPLPKL